MTRWKIIIKTVKTSRERVQIRQKLYVRIEFGQKIIVYNLLVRVNNDTTAWKKKLFISNSPPIEDSQGSSIDENRGLNLIPFDSLSCNQFLPWSQSK